MGRIAIQVTLSLLGAGIGAAVGILVFEWLLGQGLYGLVLPGAGLGLGANLASRQRSTVRGAILGVVGLIIGLGMEWKHFPFKVDDSLPYFLKHLPQLQPWTLIMIGVGAVIAFWWGSQAAPWSSEERPRRLYPSQVKSRVEGEQD